MSVSMVLWDVKCVGCCSYTQVAQSAWAVIL